MLQRQSKHTHLNQKGALFGMDARLALVVFTLLTGTLGYLSYGKLKDVRDTVLIKELNDIDFALHSYQTDMGTFIPFTIEDNRTNTEKNRTERNDISILWEKDNILPNYITDWNGPYMTISSSDHKQYGEITLTYMSDKLLPCTLYTDCFAYIGITEVPAEIWTSINKHFDESRGNITENTSDAHLKGRIRANGLGEKRTLYLQSVSRKI